MRGENDIAPCGMKQMMCGCSAAAPELQTSAALVFTSRIASVIKAAVHLLPFNSIDTIIVLWYQSCRISHLTTATVPRFQALATLATDFKHLPFNRTDTILCSGTTTAELHTGPQIFFPDFKLLQL